MKILKPDAMHQRLKAHIEATEKAQEWAEKGLKLVEEGKVAQAREAERKAKRWIEKAKSLEIPPKPYPGS